VSGRSGDDAGAVREDHWDWLMSDLARRPPSFLLDTAAAHLSRWSAPLDRYPRLSSWVASRYEPIDRIDGVVVYRRRGCSPAR
jgi:hypothetical protein